MNPSHGHPMSRAIGMPPHNDMRVWRWELPYTYKRDQTSCLSEPVRNLHLLPSPRIPPAQQWRPTAKAGRDDFPAMPLNHAVKVSGPRGVVGMSLRAVHPRGQQQYRFHSIPPLE